VVKTFCFRKGPFSGTGFGQNKKRIYIFWKPF